MATILNWIDSLWDFITGFFTWLKELLLWIPHKSFSTFLEGALSFLESIPVPQWLNDARGLFSAIPGEVWWFAGIGEFAFGLTMIGSALALRFVVRRVPFIGG